MLIRLGSLSQQSRQELSPFGGKLSGELPGNRAVGGRRPQNGGDGSKSAGSLSFFTALAL